jgi:hypothetical protein
VKYVIALIGVVALMLAPAWSALGPSVSAETCTPTVTTPMTVFEEPGARTPALRVTLGAAATIAGGDRILAVSFESQTNSVVEVNGAARPVPFAVTVQPAAPEWSFVIHPIVPGAPVLVSYTVTDRCGSIKRFSGNGSNSLIPPTGTPTAPQQTPTSSVTPTPTASPTTTMTATATVTTGASTTATPTATATATTTGAATATATPVAGPAPRPATPPAPNTYFPLGMFEAGGMLGGDQGRFAAMIAGLRAHSLDTVMFNNGSAQFHAGLLDVSDREGFNVVFSPEVELYRAWFRNAEAPATLEAARAVVWPLAGQLGGHPSLRGYNILDDATADQADKVALAVRAFWEADPAHPAMPVVVGGHEAVYAAAEPWRFLTYYYPAKARKQPCDWGFVSPTANAYAQAIRSVARDRAPGTPLWLLLQAHGATAAVDPGAPATELRTPTVEEARLQQWVALGEGATGTFWFIYSSQQFWTGLADNPALYDEVGAVSARVAPLRATLLGLHKADDRFTVDGPGSRYVSTLATADGGRRYVVAANGSCTESQALTISAPGLTGTLRDLEDGRAYPLGSPIAFRPGDGRLFEVTDAVEAAPPTPTPTARPNLLANGSFEQGPPGAVPSGWSGPPVAAPDPAAHAGARALRVAGPAPFDYLSQPLALKPATQYTVSYWARTQAAGTGAHGVGLRFAQLAASPQVATFPWAGGTADWHQVSASFFTGLDLTAGRLDLTWDLPPGGLAWIDDLVLCEGRTCAP